MNAFKTLIYQQDGPVATITINRPEVRNAINWQLTQELKTLIDQVNGEKDVKVVILTGAGKGFCAGADLTAKQQDSQPTKSTEDNLNEEYKPILMGIFQSKKIFISAINGAAAGVGSALAMVCDLTIMADDAFILEAFSTISLIPDGGATWLLVQNIGYKRALQVALEAERISAQQALAWGLTNRVVAADTLLDQARSWAQALAQRAPLALRYTKEAMRRAQDLTYSDTISFEAKIQNVCINSADFTEGVSAFFDKRQANFKGK